MTLNYIYIALLPEVLGTHMNLEDLKLEVFITIIVRQRIRSHHEGFSIFGEGLALTVNLYCE